MAGDVHQQPLDVAQPVVVARCHDDALAADGIGVNELSLHLPSLDEVFMTLTGHGTTDSKEGEAA